MKLNQKTLAAGAALACASLAAQAQSSVTLYGVLDQYLHYMHSSSGTKLKALEDGAWLRSRFGVRGQEDLGDGMFAKFQMEGGFSADNGASADTTRFWDRQAWVGLGTKDLGEIRLGRQNGPIQTHGAYVDYTARDLGSIINNFGVPSRYDNDLGYLSPRWSGFAFETHVSLPETPTGNHALVYQLWMDWTNDVVRAGYMGIRGRPPANAAIDKDMVYDNVYFNWMYGQGTVYLAYVHSNNNTKTAVSNNAGTIVGNSGGFNAGTDPNLNNFYDIWQLSADYRVTPQMRVGTLWGQIKDKSGRNQGGDGGSIGVYYDMSKRTMLWAMADTMRNDANGGWRPSGSAGPKTTFTNPSDINGRTINSLEVGIVHRF
ncbi:porin [Paucibacter sp. R3-3]|uniref:Porin n=1 Tax=Roseateles agri TaxID=3098619 RepID=A0ABU5DHK7_9BURK|nr:porin [Paucibacter sp. R3-3]MDY0745783.1 porin [Paucibacter sp. R3-3]